MQHVNLKRDASVETGADGATGRLTIDLSALARNYQKLCALMRSTRVAGVVKADAYGLGADAVSRTLYQQGCRHFFVAQFQEAVALRPLLAGDAQLLVLNGLQPGVEADCAKRGIIPVINSLEQFDRWSATALQLDRTLPAVLQFDTGMSRLGIPPEECADVAERLENGAGIEVLFLMSHLACGDEPENAQNEDQLEAMRKVAETFPGYELSLANSGGVFLGGDYHNALARPGIAVYGGRPSSVGPNPMEPVVRLEIAVVQVRTVPAGTRVGYGGTHVAASEMRLATLAAGYADGLRRTLSSRGAVYYDGVRLPIVGRVSMDSMTVDVSALPPGTLGLGSFVEVIGPDQTLEDIAEDAGTISYEILTSLGHRYHRIYL
jgi:alanine racemase